MVKQHTDKHLINLGHNNPHEQHDAFYNNNLLILLSDVSDYGANIEVSNQF